MIIDKTISSTVKRHWEIPDGVIIVKLYGKAVKTQTRQILLIENSAMLSM